ncbi:MAG: hypothetical protein U0Q11_20310 [Vicinamibacterales bacterium]
MTFANTTQFGNGARIAPRARLDDGLLDLVLFEERSRLFDGSRTPESLHGPRGPRGWCLDVDGHVLSRALR